MKNKNLSARGGSASGPKFDIVVIGGGPAGMMAAGRAAELGARVVLLEKNNGLGKKLLITGKGRCNLTQAEFDDKEIIKKFGKQGKFLFSSLAAYGPEEVIKFFEDRNVPTKIERGGRVFPRSDRAQDVLRVLEKYLEKNGVEMIYDAQVAGFDVAPVASGGKIASVKLAEKGYVSAEKQAMLPARRIYADKFILCTGGKSYPVTGSTGDGYRWAENLGHKIIPPAPALVPIKTKENWVKEVQGLSLKNVAINLLQNNRKQDSRFGEMMFAHFGLTGPIVLDLSKKAGELMAKGKVIISIDLKPALDHEQLDARLQRDFKENSNKDFINYLPELLPQKMIAVIADLSGIDPRKKINFVTKEERKKLAGLLKDLRLTADGTTGYNQAIVTSGGVDTKEVDSRTMRSRIVSNLFLAGEILDLDGPTGGYNLQMCWSTGYAAGTYAANLEL
ncbi:MAG: NAD(P)/FAD-dependent oxidoreductase [Candidatus Moranbacteria bacterium]|nr:NAD(P)/FAD-dependent oxidoreductase [Candidatus Moranbacteria bacterium]